MPRIKPLTPEARKAAAVDRMAQRLAAGLTVYRAQHKLTVPEMGDRLGVGRSTMYALLRAEPCVLTSLSMWTVLHAAGLRVEDERRPLWGVSADG